MKYILILLALIIPFTANAQQQRLTNATNMNVTAGGVTDSLAGWVSNLDLDNKSISMNVSGGTVNLTPDQASYGVLVLQGVLLSPLNIVYPSGWMGKQIIKNNISGGGVSTLSSSIDNVVTTINISSSDNYPLSGNYSVVIDSEKMDVTGGQGTTTLTVSRSSPASHSSGAKVLQLGTGFYPVYAKYTDQPIPTIVGQGLSSLLIGDGNLISVQSPNGFNRCSSCFAFVGDSRLKRIYSGVSNSYVQDASSFFNIANVLSGNTYQISYLGATSGHRTDQYLSVGGVSSTTEVFGPTPKSVYGLSGAIKSGAKNLIIWGALNDIAQYATTGDTVSSIWQRLYYAAETARGAGMDVIFLSEPGATSSTYTSPTIQNPMVYSLNQYIREYVEGISNVPNVGSSGNAKIYDISSAIVDNTATSGISFKTNYSTDGIHLNSYGGWFAGLNFYTWLDASNISKGSTWTWYNADNTTAYGTQLVANPLFLTSTGGTAGASVSGTVAANWTVNVGGSSSAVASVVSNGLGFGNAQKVECTFGAKGDFCRVQTSVASGSIPTGTIFEAGGVVRVLSGSSNCVIPTLQGNYVVGGTTYNSKVLYDSSTQTYATNPSTEQTYYLRTVPMTVQGTTTSGYSLQFIVWGSGSGSCSFEISRPFVTVRKS